MNEILIFLLIFAASMVISHLGHATLFVRFLIAPFFGTLGVMLSHHGLGILRAPTLLSLDLFTQVALTWLSFLLGLRRLAYIDARTPQLTRQFCGIFVTFLITFVLTMLSMWLFPIDAAVKSDPVLLLMLAVLSAALLIGREPIFFRVARIININAIKVSLIGAVPFLCFVYAKKSSNIFEVFLPFVAGIFAAIFCLVIYHLLSISISVTLDLLILILISLCALLSGVAIWFFVPHVIVGFLFGVLCSFKREFEPYLRPLFLSEQPMRIVLMILIGAHLQVSLPPMLCGLLLGVLIYLIRILVHVAMKTYLNYRGYFSSFMGASEVSVIFLASFMFVLPAQHSLLNDVLLFVMVASSVGDVLGVARWSLILRARKINKSQISAEIEL